MNYKVFWDQLGTAFSKLDEDAKAMFEGIWELVYNYLDDLNTQTYTQQFNMILRSAFPFYKKNSKIVTTYCNGNAAFKEEYNIGDSMITGEIVVPGGVVATHSTTSTSLSDKLQVDEPVFTRDKIYLFNGKNFIEFDGNFILWGTSGYGV